tara:strand:+ start:2934 stop:3068 length:135 start_codon:yes stop_codon:yes gene_type:complete
VYLHTAWAVVLAEAVADVMAVELSGVVADVRAEEGAESEDVRRG